MFPALIIKKISFILLLIIYVLLYEHVTFYLFSYQLVLVHDNVSGKKEVGAYCILSDTINVAVNIYV